MKTQEAARLRNDLHPESRKIRTSSPLTLKINQSNFLSIKDYGNTTRSKN